MAIANTLKVALTPLYGMTYDQLYGNLKDHVDHRYGCTPRELCSRMSLHLKRNHGGDFLVRRLFDEIRSRKYESPIIITDLRYEQDCRYVRNHKGIIIKVTRQRAPAVFEEEAHIDTLPADIHIANDSSLKELNDMVLYKLYSIQSNRM
jgi:hypothetical protein